MRVELHPEARAELRAAAVWAELRAAAGWYDERRPGLGDELVDEVSSIFARIGEAPGSFPRWPATFAASLDIRGAVLDRFPYVIAFEVRAEHVLVLAVAHAKRRPLYWLTRAL